MKSLKDPQFCSRQPLYSSPMQPGNTGFAPRFVCGTMPCDCYSSGTCNSFAQVGGATMQLRSVKMLRQDLVFPRTVLGCSNFWYFSLAQNHIKTCLATTNQRYFPPVPGGFHVRATCAPFSTQLREVEKHLGDSFLENTLSRMGGLKHHLCWGSPRGCVVSLHWAENICYPS